ncbi:MAG: helix-turn-helix transcriptional regulator [Spirochaetales bacterium]|nr:helix-turn-helix transcriptional regulator [Spirochaetales bacterium]
MTQAQIAQLIGIEQYLVSSYVTGRLHLSDDMLIRFAKALGASSDSILGLDGSEIEQLPLPKQKVLLQTIDGFLKGEGI